jgi:hypothetical protein
MATSQQLVLTACAFQRPRRIPRFDSFWEFPAAWREKLGPPERLSDISIWYPDEAPFPSRARHLRSEGGYVYEVDAWGRTVRRRDGAFFVETLEVALPQGADPDSLTFEPPEADSRFFTGRMHPPAVFRDGEEAAQALQADKQRYCVFGKTGGPYLRSTFLRGETQFLMDIAGDPPLARKIADKVADHLTRVGIEEIRRWHLRETGIWIYDDMACNRGPLLGPRQFEAIFLPAYRRMIRAYKDAGCRYVFFHSDGDIRPLLDMLVDAGIDGLNPLERRANMDMIQLRKRYPRLILTGGMCNTHTLVKGSKAEIEAEAREIIDLGRDGGVVIGTHSVSPEIPLENFMVYHQVCAQYGDYSVHVQ